MFFLIRILQAKSPNEWTNETSKWFELLIFFPLAEKNKCNLLAKYIQFVIGDSLINCFTHWVSIGLWKWLTVTWPFSRLTLRNVEHHEDNTRSTQGATHVGALCTTTAHTCALYPGPEQHGTSQLCSSQRHAWCHRLPRPSWGGWVLFRNTNASPQRAHIL